jgi:hypothetical protein
MSTRRTTDERYGAATQASSLVVDPDERGHVDYLVAAGWGGAHLGAMLHRLRTEWDLAAGEYRLAMQHQHKVELSAARTARMAQRTSDKEKAADMLREAAQDLQQAAREALTARALAMVHLKTLHEAKQALGAFANYHADRLRLPFGPNTVNALAGRALQAWLDAICGACSGRGFNGGYLTPKVLCTQCSATGRAQYRINTEDRAGHFQRFLLAKMDAKCERVERAIARRVSNFERSQTKKLADRREVSEQQLQRRLTGLRTTVAEQD